MKGVNPTVSHIFWWYFGGYITEKKGRIDLGAAIMRQTYIHVYTDHLWENIGYKPCTQPVKQERKTKINEVNMRRGSQVRTETIILGQSLGSKLSFYSWFLQMSCCHIEKSPMGFVCVYFILLFYCVCVCVLLEIRKLHCR